MREFSCLDKKLTLIYNASGERQVYLFAGIKALLFFRELQLITTLLTTAIIATASFELPRGYEDTRWGMSVEDLTSQQEVHRASPGSEYGYADHAETDPDVYVRTTEDNTRIEYYFFEGLLYKIYVVYDREKSSADFYQERILATRKKYGPAQSHYQERVFGLLVLHVKWDDGKSTLDLRSGAGYIYEVYVDKDAERRKASKDRKRNIKKKSI